MPTEPKAEPVRIVVTVTQTHHILVDPAYYREGATPQEIADIMDCEVGEWFRTCRIKPSPTTAWDVDVAPFDEDDIPAWDPKVNL